MKAYTDLEQSKRLSEILSLDSADMYYINGGGQPVLTGWVECGHDYDDIPCWSLAALLNVLPSKFYPVGGHETILTLGKFPDKWCALYYDATGMQDGPQILADNPIDCCVEMIIKIYEQNKERLQEE